MLRAPRACVAEVQRLLGRMSSVELVNPGVRLWRHYLNRSLAGIANPRPSQRVALSPAIREELRWWVEIAPKRLHESSAPWRSVQLASASVWAVGATDASELGFGGLWEC